ncbi:hypothetical protein [Aureimonas ureilytica]|uniref:hypothetical protein n=1 Tax=Aureimonas ureilytica TaxID=401562 RepID=UPI000375B8E6|nr:hypothetical protein [Aureimonas ureilytica]
MFKARLERRIQWLGHKALAALYRGPSKVKVGFPAGKAGADIVQRAVWNEFGTRGGASGGGWGGPVPERPFMRNAMRENRDKYRRAMIAAARSTLMVGSSGFALRSGSPLRNSLDQLGILAQGHIQGEITSLASPPNSPVTIALKGSSNPLIDTGEMRQRVTWKVDDA